MKSLTQSSAAGIILGILMGLFFPFKAVILITIALYGLAFLHYKFNIAPQATMAEAGKASWRPMSYLLIPLWTAALLMLIF